MVVLLMAEQMPVVCRPRRKVRGGKSRPAPYQVVAYLSTSAAFDDIAAASVILSSLPGLLGVSGHSDQPKVKDPPRRSRPDPSLPLHRHYLRRCHHESLFILIEFGLYLV